MNGGLPQPPGGFDPYGAQFQEDPNRQQQLAALPQPQPSVAPPPDPSSQTLGAAGVAPTSTNPMVDEFNQYVQALMPQVQQAQRQYLPQTSAPGIFANIVTMGGAAAAHHMKEAAYNAGVDNYNQQLKLYAMDMAKDLVNEHAKAQALGAQSELSMLKVGLSLKDMQIKLAEQARKNANDQFNQEIKTTVGPPTGEQMRASLARGKKWVPSRIPGRYEEVPIGGGVGGLERDANGNWGLPGMGAAPGSPAADPGAAETDVDRLNKIEGEKKAATTIDTAATRTRQETAGKVLNLIADARKDLAAAETSGRGVGPFASRYRGVKTALGVSDPVFTRYKDQVGLLHSLLMNMHTGSRSSEMLLKKFEGMADPTKQSAENMRAMFDVAERYARTVDQHKGEESPDELTAVGAPSAGTKPTEGGLGKPSRLTLDQFLAE